MKKKRFLLKNCHARKNERKKNNQLHGEIYKTYHNKVDSKGILILSSEFYRFFLSNTMDDEWIDIPNLLPKLGGSDSEDEQESFFIEVEDINNNGNLYFEICILKTHIHSV